MILKISPQLAAHFTQSSVQAVADNINAGKSM
jgi:hypothetical protein